MAVACHSMRVSLTPWCEFIVDINNFELHYSCSLYSQLAVNSKASYKLCAWLDDHLYLYIQ